MLKKPRSATYVFFGTLENKSILNKKREERNSKSYEIEKRPEAELLAF